MNFAGHLIHCKHCDRHFPVALDPGDDEPTPAPPDHIFGVHRLPDDEIPLAPLAEDEEKHCRERYEARVLSKNRNELPEHEEHAGR